MNVGFLGGRSQGTYMDVYVDSYAWLRMLGATAGPLGFWRTMVIMARVPPWQGGS